MRPPAVRAIGAYTPEGRRKYLILEFGLGILDFD
jgi:hypothetical protein